MPTETQGRWFEVANSDQVERVITSVRETLPSGGTSLYNAFDFLGELDSKPDNIFIITDGLPTQEEIRREKIRFQVQPD